METTVRKDKLRGYLDGMDTVDSVLPSTHIANAYHLDEIIDSGSLIPKLCPVINEELTYFFYGRPSYRAKRGRSSALQFDWPIVFVVDTKKIDSLKRIFPFDSGAFNAGLYGDFFEKNSMLGDFELKPDLMTVRKIVRTFYVTNDGYYDGSVNQNFPQLVREFEVEGLKEMARCPGISIAGTEGTRDERSTSIELQSDTETILENALIGLVLPTLYLDDEETKRAIEKWRIKEISTYDVINNVSPEVVTGQLYEKVKTMYKKMGVLAK